MWLMRTSGVRLSWSPPRTSQEEAAVEVITRNSHSAAGPL